MTDSELLTLAKAQRAAAVEKHGEEAVQALEEEFRPGPGRGA